jgi:hypothetical protein
MEAVKSTLDHSISIGIPEPSATPSIQSTSETAKSTDLHNRWNLIRDEESEVQILFLD